MSKYTQCGEVLKKTAHDTERVESYYAGLLAQIEKRVAKWANDAAAAAEKERSRAQAFQERSLRNSARILNR